MAKIEYFPLEEITPYANNPRKTEKAVAKVVESVQRFGFNVPLLLDKGKVIIAGHTRYQAAKELGIKTVPCIILDGLTKKQVRQLRIVDNKVGEVSSWDYEKLLFELDGITEVDMGAFDLGGFEDAPETDIFSNLDEGKEIDLEAFDDEAFEYECPFCGFKWNE